MSSRSSSFSSSSGKSEKDKDYSVVYEVDSPQCRICYEGEIESGEDLISPCNCTGSVRHVHTSCLNRWRALNIDNHNRDVCSLCNGSYRLQSESCFDALFPTQGNSNDMNLNHFLLKQRIYNSCIRFLSICSLAPLAVSASIMSRFTGKHKDIHFGQPEQPWDEHTFGLVFGNAAVAEINKLILSKDFEIGGPSVTWRASMVYGFTKLGYYGCTWWLFTDGLSEAFPRELNRSPFFLLVKAMLEFLVIPHCLNTPRSRLRLPPFLFATCIGIIFILKKIEKKLRKATIGLMPDFEEFELGRFVER